MSPSLEITTVKASTADEEVRIISPPSPSNFPLLSRISPDIFNEPLFVTLSVP